MSERPATARLRAEGLVKRYKDRTVVNDVAIEVATGEVVGLLGPNGAGKTTTFYSIVGLVRADGGSVYLDDQEITVMPLYKRARCGIGYLPQETSVFRKLTVRENLMAILESLPLNRAARQERLERLLAEFGLSDRAESRAYTLSGGERRRLEIARCLITDPKFLLLDEPFAGIDPIAVIDIQEIIKKLRQRGIGVLITDHNVRETLAITDRAYVMSHGKILTSGTSAFLANDPQAKKIYLGPEFRLH